MAEKPKTKGLTGFKNSMNGNYTIGGTSPDYATFNAAKTDLYALGVCGPVTFSVRSGTYTEQLNFNGKITGATGVNTVKFKADAANTTAATLTYTSDFTIKFGGGVSYVSFDSLNLETSSFANVVELATANDHISFNGNNFKGYNTTSSSRSYAVVYDWNGNNTTQFSFTNNKVNYGSQALYMYGANSSSQQDGFTIQNNTFTNMGYYGIYMYYCKNGLIEGNDISYRTGAYNPTGLYGYYNISVDIKLIILKEV